MLTTACDPRACAQQASHDPSTYSYCLKSGTMDLLTAACDWYERRYGVKYDPRTEALSLIGGCGRLGSWHTCHFCYLRAFASTLFGTCFVALPCMVLTVRAFAPRPCALPHPIATHISTDCLTHCVTPVIPRPYHQLCGSLVELTFD